MSPPFHRSKILDELQRRSTPWDFVVIGGGATGVAIAMDAASRGYAVVLLEQSDFGKGTSSRSTKLVHGGVRYLRQGNIRLVREALHERALLRRNAPHLVHELAFLLPCANQWQRIYYGAGLKLYDALAVRDSFTGSHGVGHSQAKQLVPALRDDCFSRGIVYHDGQFDDARLLINMARTARHHGACLLNYAAVENIIKSDHEQVSGVRFRDTITRQQYDVSARCVINATGPFCDAIRQLDQNDCPAMIAPSQGIHLVLPHDFFPGETALIIPKTPDGRVIFIIPWHNHAIVGTTDTPIPYPTLEPDPQPSEIEYLLATSAQYLAKPPRREDVLGIFTGIRPLVRGSGSAKTSALSRDHTIEISPSKLITITGGKWTTARKMAEDCVDRAIETVNLPPRRCVTSELPIHGWVERPSADPRSFYGSDLDAIKQLEHDDPALARPLIPALSIYESDVVWGVRMEMAMTVEDVLARRTRALFLQPQAAKSVAPRVAALMAREMDADQQWIDEQTNQFNEVTSHYLVPDTDHEPTLS